MSEVTYITEIIAAMESLGGMGSLKEIYAEIERRGRLTSIATNLNWRDNVRAEIQRHCSLTQSYAGGDDLFYPVKGLSEGYWGMIEWIDRTEGNDPVVVRKINEIKNSPAISSTEKVMLIKSRVGQGIFRERLIEKYGECLVTGINDVRLLRASHIKPWRDSNNYERLSSENGLLLSPLYDALFDVGLITFDQNMRMLVSGQITSYNAAKIEVDTERIFLHDPSPELMKNMEYHRNVVFKE